MGTMSERSGGATLALLLVVFLAACGATSSGNSPAPETEDPQSITFPVQDPSLFNMDALIEGTLTEREHCLYVAGESPYDFVLPIWPHGFSYERADGAIVVLDPDGQTVAQTNSPVSMGGGMSGEKDAPLPPELQSRVGSCDGPYWIVGEITGG